jgi:hypothetical protein
MPKPSLHFACYYATHTVNRQRSASSIARAGLQPRQPSLREELVKIGAKVVRDARYAIFQMAEVAVPRELFEQSCG